MELQRERLLSLIEFAQQTAALRASPISDINNHRVFAEYEHSLKGLPGMHFNDGGEEGEIWLRVERLHEIPAPTPKNNLLNAWIDLSNSPTKLPALRNAIERSKLVEIGFYGVTGADSNDANSKTAVYLKDFEEKVDIENHLNAYITTQWNIWANEEKNRRHAIKLYGQLYTLKQQLEGGIVDTQIEIVWGIGMAIWKVEGAKICYPLITQTVDIVINENTMAIELRPRETEPRLELDIYTALANSGCANLEKAWKEFNSKQTQLLSPFDRSTYEPILKLATACLDAKGIYWPSQIQAEDRTLPSPGEDLRITDTWVLFARPRSKNLFIQDLERFKTEVKDENEKFILPNAIASIVTDPSNEQQENVLSNYRGLSMVYGNDENTTKAPQDLFFPMPFNDEQVRIVQLLDSHDGVVVQGPPGTGKTHTIANIICHYFALGKRVLITSMKEPALSVLRDKLPSEIRSLAISLLASEHDGMKQFEHAIYQISAEIQHIDKQGYRREIANLETNHINALHGQLSLIDKNIETWAKKSLHPISISGATITPLDAAKEVIENSGCFEWLDDNLMPSSNYDPQFSDADIITLRNARKLVSSNLNYLSERLPEIDALPDSKDIIGLHQDLSRHTQLSLAIETGRLLSLADYEDNTIQDIAFFLENLRLLSSYKSKIQENNAGWTTNAYNLCRQPNSSVIGFLAIFEKLSKEIFTILNERKKYIEKPVFVPEEAQHDEKIITAINNKIENKLPFGIAGLIGKSKYKTRLEEIKVVSKSPETTEDWMHVQGYLNLLTSCR